MEKKEKLKGTVFNIQRFTVHDGPGIRTEIFLKGCTMRCKWCSNPESQNFFREPGIYITKCIGEEHCGLCSKACPTDSIIREEHGFVRAVNRISCLHCLKCAEVCPSNAIKSWGINMTVDEVMDEILADRALMEHSGGGVTFSGGESLCQIDFLLELLKACKFHAIHTCVESALHVARENIVRTLPFTDLYIFDLKDCSDLRHRAFTGVGNETVLQNAKYLSKTGKPLIVRIPIIPNHNDMFENIEGIRDFILNEMDNKPVQIQFLRFRQLGEEKYISLGRTYQMTENPEREKFEKHIRELSQIMLDAGLPGVVGTNKKIFMISRNPE